MTLHKSIPLASRHAPHAFEYADAAARAAAGGLTATDVGKTARQLDDNSTWMLTNHVGPVWRVVGVGDHGELTGLGDDDHPHYALRAYAVAAVVASPRTVTAADAGKILVWLGTGAVTFTLPTATSVGAGFRVRIQNKGFSPPASVITINAVGADNFSLGASNTGTSLVSGTSGDNGASIELISNGATSWQAALGDGTWTDGVITRHFDAHLPGGTTGNLVTIDANDDLQDSGTALSSLATTAYVLTAVAAVDGGGGSDMAIYSNIAGDFAAVYKDGDEIELVGLPAYITAVQIRKIIRKPTGTAQSVVKVRGTDLVCTWTPDATIDRKGAITTTSLGTLASTDEYIVEIDGPPKGYHAPTDSAKAMVINAMHYCNDGKIADLTADSVEIVKPMLADGYNAFSLHVTLGAAGDGVRVLASNDPAAGATYYDVTAMALGTPAVVVSGAYQTAEPLMFQWVKLVITGTTSAIVYLTRFRK